MNAKTAWNGKMSREIKLLSVRWVTAADCGPKPKLARYAHFLKNVEAGKSLACLRLD
jgi:hypothetical protein